MVRGKQVRGPTNLPPAFVPVGISGGVDLKTDYKLVQAPSTVQALNVRYGTAGSVRKRFGLAALGSMTGATTCFATASEIIACDNVNMYGVTVGTGALTTRGTVGAASVASTNIISLGTQSTQVVRSVQTEYVTAGGITYGLCVYEYGTNPQPASSNLSGGMDVGGALYFVLFNAQTGATLWTSTTNGILASSSAPFRFINTVVSTPVVNSYPNSSAGAMYPCITSYNGKFIVTWIAALQTGTITDSGTSLTGCIYAVQSITFTPSSTIAITGTTLGAGTSICSPFPAVIAGQPSSSGAYSPALPVPIRYDIRTNGSDVLLWATGQNYNALSGSTAVLYRTVGAVTLYSNAASFVAPNVASFAVPVPATLSSVTLAPANGMYGVVYANSSYAQLVFPNYSSTPAVTVSTAQSAAGSFANQPFSAVFSPSSTQPTMLTAFDGATTANYSLIYSNPVVIGSTSLAASGTYVGQIDYSYQPITPASGQLASRLFLFNSNPVGWIIPASVSRSSIASLALVQVLPLTAYNQPAARTFAQAAYLRVCTPGIPVDSVFGYAPTNGFPLQACNVSTSTFSGQPAFAYIGNINSQERIVSLRTLTVAPDTAGVARSVVRTPQGALYLGADPKYYDGSTCRKMGWLTIPEYNFQGNSAIITATTLTGYTASNVSNNQGLCYNTAYTFFFVHVDYDAQGNVIYGSTSPPMSITTPSTTTGKFVLFIPQQMIPSRGFLQVYRNTGLAPLTYVKTRQFSQADVKGYGGIYVGVVDDTGAGNAINVNGVSTETLSGGLLYAPPSGGELPNDPPPASSMGVSTKQRIFLVSQENPTWVYFSKPFFPGRAPEFNTGQLLDIDPTTGPITGIAALDSTIVVFKRGHIYSFGGDGPDATGSGAFTSILQIATDLGCEDTASLLTTEDGVWFRSGRGLQALTRGGQVVYSATQIEPLLTGNTVVASALIANQNQLRFSLSNGNVLVFDYLLKVWSVFVTLRPGSAAASPPTSFAKLSGSVYTTNAAGDLCVETSGFQDGTNNIPMTVQSAWIPTSGPQGWGRIRRVAALGDFRSAHSLTMSFSYDYASTPTYSIPYSATTAAQQSPYNWRVRAPRQVCQAVQITLTDNAPAGEGAILTGLVLELEPKSAALRVPDTQSV